MELQSLTENDLFSPREIAAMLRTSQKEIADTLGLSRDALSRKTRLRSRATQTRLREMLEILNRLVVQGSSPLVAYAWFRSSPLPGFGGATPEKLVREGHADWVHAYLEQIAAGGFA